jgi:YVTN family beta-propeller protein
MDGASTIGPEITVPNDSTNWTATLTGLTAKAYSLKAKALYGTGLPDSAAKAFTVTAVVTPTLTDVSDAQGSVVGEITVATSVTVTGTGSSGQKIQLMDGASTIGPEITVPNDSTNWSATLTGLTAKAYSLKAKALYGTGVPDSAAKAFTVTAVVAPTLIDVSDAQGSVVGGITVATSVTVTGTGSSGQRIQLVDGATNIGDEIIVPADSTNWSATLTSLTTKAYSLKAKALYGTGVPDSAAKAFTVTAVVTPTLTDIRDAQGSVVGGITVATSVTVTGTGSSGQRIQLVDGATNIGDEITVPADSTNWSATLTSLTAKAYSLKAKVLYGTGVPDSAAKAFNVTQLLTPTLDNVKDANEVEIPDATTTVSTTLKLSGQASKGQKVEVYEGNGATAQPKGQATADATTGIWRLTITVETGARRLYAKSLYHSGDVYSNVRTLNVVPELPAGINVGLFPYDHALSPDGAYLYVCVLESEKIAVISTATHTVTREIQSPKSRTRPWSIAISPDGIHAYVTLHTDILGAQLHVIAVIDLTNDSLIGEITLPLSTGDSAVKGLAVTRDGAYLYYVENGQTIRIYETRTYSLIETITLPRYLRYLGCTVSATGQFCIAGYSESNPRGNHVDIIDMATHTLLQTTPISTGSDYYALTIGVDSDGAHAYIGLMPYPGNTEGRISVIDLKTGDLIKIIDVPDASGGMYLITSPNDARVYFATNKRYIGSLNTEELTLMQNIPISNELVGNGVYHLTASFDGSLVYGSMTGEYQVAVIPTWS